MILLYCPIQNIQTVLYHVGYIIKVVIKVKDKVMVKLYPPGRGKPGFGLTYSDSLMHNIFISDTKNMNSAYTVKVKGE